MGTEKPMKTVTILLTKYSDGFGKFISAISKNGYSHAFISIDRKEEMFYSFNYKGFVIEKPKKYFPKKRLPGSECIRMQVPDSTYALIEDEISRFSAMLIPTAKYILMPVKKTVFLTASFIRQFTALQATF